MRKEPKVVILTINFNSEDMTLNCLKDLDKLNYKNKKLIILDNGSKSESLKKIEKCKKKYGFELLKLGKNTGYTGGANYLLEYIRKNEKYDYVLFINNDMLFPDKNFLRKMVDKIEKNQSVGIINPLVLNRKGKIQDGGADLNEFLKYTKRMYVNSPLEEMPRQDYFVDLYCGCSWLVREKIINEDAIKFKDEYFAYSEDESFCIDVIKKGYKIMVDVSSKVIHLGGSSADRIGSGFALKLITRNGFWMRKEYATRKQRIIYFSNYFLSVFPKTIIYLLLIKRDFKALRSYIEGLKEGLSN